MLSDVCGAKPQVALSPRNQSTRVLMHSHDSHFPMLELLCCGLVVLLLQLLQQSCWQAPCGEVGRVGQAARAGSLEKRPRRSRLRRNAIFQHANKCIAKLTPQAMTASFFFFSFSARLALDRPPVSAASLGCDLMGRQFVRSTFHEDTARSSSAPSELLMEEVLSACGWAVQPQTLGFLNLLCVAG